MTTLTAVNADSADEATVAEALRVELVDTLVARDTVRSSPVEAAMRVVPRHLFLAGEPLTVAYADEAVITRRGDDATPLSSVSQPSVVATMLEQARLQPGERVLEIGTGKGYNAALLARLTDPAGEVVTVEIDPGLVTDARQALTAAGYPNVHVVCGDGEYGAGDHAPYSLVMVTVGAADIPPAWVDQLTPDGRIILPLRVRGLHRLIAFERADGHLVSRDIQVFGFVAMQGEGATPQRTLHLGGAQVRLVVDDSQPADATVLGQALTSSGHIVWTGVSLSGAERVLPHLDLWLASTLDTYGRLHADGDHCGLLGPTLPAGSSTTWEQDSLAYLTVRDAPGSNSTGGYELGACAYGPAGDQLAARLADQIRRWHREMHSRPGAVIRAYPAGTPDDRLAAGRVVDRRHTRFVLAHV